MKGDEELAKSLRMILIGSTVIILGIVMGASFALLAL